MVIESEWGILMGYNFIANQLLQIPSPVHIEHPLKTMVDVGDKNT